MGSSCLSHHSLWTKTPVADEQQCQKNAEHRWQEHARFPGWAARLLLGDRTPGDRPPVVFLGVVRPPGRAMCCLAASACEQCTVQR